MSTNLKHIITEAEQKVAASNNLKEIEDLRVAYLGKSGVVTLAMKDIATLPPEEKKSFGAAVNEAKNNIAYLIDTKKEALETEQLNAKLASEKIDLTLPIRSQKTGSIHPISQVIDELVEIFGSMGFNLKEGPDVETDFNNFTALNFPDNHPAREMHDTFFMSDTNAEGEKLLLRTHTSSVQVRTMKNGKPPFRSICAGRTYRCDSDVTHSPMFHQLEGFVVDTNINMAHLKGCLVEFLEKFFGVENIPVRFRPSFFPFTEPSAEVDIGCERKNGELKIGAGSGWLEVLGCGMIHPNVLKNCGIDPNEYQGFAFGMGVERLAMLKYGISDLRNFFESDSRFLQQYSFKALDIPRLVAGL
jgi:phenylalanyl-tRNA synthetase alpha chain